MSADGLHSPLTQRSAELPRFLRTASGSTALRHELEQVTEALAVRRLSVLAGASRSRAVADRIRSSLAVPSEFVCVADNSIATVEQLAASDQVVGGDLVVAVGGGKVIDVAKAVCLQADLPLVVIPTLLSGDGIASPVSVLMDGEGQVDSFPGRLPVAVLVDLDEISAAPRANLRAGLGDLLANPNAVEDWRLAAERRDEEIDDFAALLAVSACELAWSADLASMQSGAPTPDLLKRLLHGLVLSGLAMEIAGSSRPCSGAEHLVSHAIDRLFPGTATHGEQVAWGTLLVTRLRGGDWPAVKEQLAEAGLEAAAGGLGLSSQQLVQAVQAAPATRPKRYTVLNEIDLIGPAVEDAVREVTR